MSDLELKSGQGFVEALRDVLQSSCQVRDIENTPFAVVPEGYKLESLAHFLDNPVRKKGAVVFYDSASFIRYFVEQQQDGSKIYGRLTGQFEAVFDDHTKDLSGWKEHRAKFGVTHSLQWATWTRNNKQQMPQEKFAQFIEDNLPDIVAPEAAHILEVSRSLQAKKKVNFSSGIRLANGQNEFTYEEEIQGTTAKGKLHVPETFTLGLPVFENGTGYKVEARLRYRINEGGLTMWYDLLRPEKFVEDAVREIWAEIESGTEVEILNGVA